MTDAPKVAGPMKLVVGSSANATVAFKDNTGAEVKVSRVSWASDNPLFSIMPDENDPTSAKITVGGSGRAYITATGVGENGGTAVASTNIVAFDKGTLAKGEITVSPVLAPTKQTDPSKEKETEPSDKETVKTSTSPPAKDAVKTKS